MALSDATLAALLGTGASLGSGVAELNAFDKTLQQNDFWRQASIPILSAKFDTRTWSPAAQIGTAAGQSFLGSLLNAIGQHSEADQAAKVASILPALYRNPSSIDLPDGVDKEAFTGLKMAAMAKQAAREEAVQKTLNEKGIVIGPDGKASVIPGFESAIQSVFSAENTGRQKGKGLSLSSGAQRALSDLKGTLAGIAALNHNDQRISALPGEDSYLGGVGRWWDKNVDPNSDTAKYARSLPFLADPLTVGLSGSSKIGILQKTLESLNPAFAESKTSMLDASNEARLAMIEKGAKLLDTLQASGVDIGMLQDYKDQLDAGAAGSLVDDAYLKPKVDLSGATQSPIKAILEKEAATLKAQGVPASQIAGILRARHSGGTPFG